ncbi:hypothetical protein SDC9_133055 [bioreactor metagenome]|uniref:Uncharacterized protein n=1 Tax=bioreactor metagenome TaxID=1076179 RepID=A0A645DBL1_9ZZZZ
MEPVVDGAYHLTTACRQTLGKLPVYSAQRRYVHNKRYLGKLFYKMCLYDLKYFGDLKVFV